jgi:hypothetical protein
MSASLASGTYRPIAFGPAVVSSFQHWGRVLWFALEALGRGRARAHLLQTAAQYEHINPDKALLLRQAALALSSPPR